jgi:hypothetical protein
MPSKTSTTTFDPPCSACRAPRVLRPKRWGVALIATLVVTGFASSGAAQSPGAAIEGVVVDSTSQRVPGATVDLRDAGTNQHRTVVTDDRGTFGFVGLLPGAYDIRVTLDGFAPFVQEGLVLAIGATARLTIPLSPAGVAESVTVSAQPPPIDPSRTSAATVVDPERIEELPVRSRNYLEFALLAPGVGSSRQSSQTAPSAALPDSGFTFGGLRPRSNTLTIDGLDNNDAFNGGSRTELSLELVQEFEVLTNGWSVERGGASGGAINVVTKSGANTLHGDTFLFAQNGALNAVPFLEDTGSTKPSLRRYRVGLAIGGPLVKDHTFYYAAGEREQTHDQAASDVGAQTVSQINRVLATGVLGGQSITSGLFPTALAETELSAKLTHQLTARQSVTTRIASTDARDTRDAFNAGGLVDVTGRGTRHTTDLAWTGGWTAVVSDHVTNEIRGQAGTRRITQSTDTNAPGVVIEGVAEFGQPYVPLGDNRQRYLEGADTLTMVRGRHLVRAGFDVTRTAVDSTMSQGSAGLYLFSDLSAFVAQQPDSYRRAFGVAPRTITSTRTGVFVQDHWTVAPSLSLDLGLRGDVVAWPSQLSITQRQLEPRAGFAWSPSPNWVIRGGAGIFADRLPLAAVDRVLAANGAPGVEQILAGPLARAALVDGGAHASPTPAIAASIYTLHTGAWRPSSRQASIGAERLLAPDLTVSANYLFVRGLDLPRTVNVNLPAPVTLTALNATALGFDTPSAEQIDRPVFGPQRLNPAFDGIFELQPSASSTYHGVSFTLNRRLSHEIEWATSYTWSHTTDTASDFDEQPQNPFALIDEQAPSRYDQRHRLVASALFDLPIGDEEDRTPGTTPGLWVRAFSNIEVAPILTIGSGQPVNPVTGVDDTHAHAFPLTARPLSMDRNSVRLPAFAALDLRVLKAIPVKPHGKLDLVVEAFNVLNRQNVIQLNPVFGSGVAPVASFGRPIDAANARHIQFSIDFEF